MLVRSAHASSRKFMVKAPGLKQRFIQTVRVSANTGNSKDFHIIFGFAYSFGFFGDFNVFLNFWGRIQKNLRKCLDFAAVDGQNHCIL